MKIPRIPVILSALPVLCCLLAPLPSRAVTINLGPGAGPATVTTVGYDDSYPKWLAADLADPVNPDYLEIVNSASAGAWILELNFPPGSPDLVTGAVFDIEQLLTLDSSSQPLSGWRQQILTGGWEWQSGSVFDFDSALPLAGLLTSGEGSGTLTSTFNAVSSPVNLSVVGTLKYTGPGGPAMGLSLAITPVPEPGALVLGLAASALVLLRRRAGSSSLF